MMLRLQKFDLLVSYKKGTEMYLADTLSRAFRMCQRARQDTTEDVVCIEELRSNTERELKFVNMIQYLPVSEATQIAIKQATESDATLRDLKTLIREAWPACNLEVPENIRNYFPFREELSLQNGLVIPARVKDEMLAKIHASHIGIQGSIGEHAK